VRDAVRNAWADFNAPFEGVLPYPYLDKKRLVTTGMGDLIDPISLALGLPWQRLDGSSAPIDEVSAAWRLVKSRTDLADAGGKAFASLTSIRLSPQSITNLVAKKLATMEATLRSRPSFAAFDSWPADAQMGLLSMSWAMGELFNFPKFQSAVALGRFDIAAGPAGDASANPALRGEAWMENNGLPGPNPANPGLHRRNLATRLCFANAWRVVQGLSPDTFYYPAALG
jgi:hypothetical protein